MHLIIKWILVSVFLGFLWALLTRCFRTRVRGDEHSRRADELRMQDNQQAIERERQREADRLWRDEGRE